MSEQNQIRVSDLVAANHLQDFNSNALEQVLYGGRASYKSSRNALKIAIKMLEEPCEVMVVRENYKDHKSTTFADLKWAFNKLGVNLKQKKHYPEGNDLYIKIPNGSLVHFRHMKDMDSLKGTRASNPNLSIKIIWFYEITEMKSAWHLENAISGFVRGAQDWFWILYEFNPAPKLSHWTYEWLDKIDGTSNTLCYKSIYTDVPEEQQRAFLGDIYIERIDKLKRVDPEQWKSIYLGLPANLSGTVYKQFDPKKHVKPATWDYIDMSIGVDFGSTDATTFTAKGIRPDYKGMEYPMHYYHKNGKSLNIKNINDYVDDFFEFVEKVHRRYGKALEVHIDPANKVFKQLVEERSYDYNYLIIEEIHKLPRTKHKSQVQERVDLTEIMFGADFLTIDPSCKELIKAFMEAEYGKDNERADDGRSNIDSLDSAEYSWLNEMEFIEDLILGG
jgi:phage terminase large subunit